ncbi:alcohol dehydrogenase catalytic domain-containing protein, partial [Campylobacter coli]
MDSKIFLENGRIQSKGYAMLSKDAKFTPFEFTRHAVGDNDILIKILYAGICHSDIHTARSEWGEAVYPCVPGHEIAGEVIAVGKNV